MINAHAPRVIFEMPELRSIDNVQHSLEKDKARYCSGMDRFRVKLPESPQHKKYCSDKTLIPASPRSAHGERGSTLDLPTLLTSRLEHEVGHSGRRQSTRRMSAITSATTGCQGQISLQTLETLFYRFPQLQPDGSMKIKAFLVGLRTLPEFKSLLDGFDMGDLQKTIQAITKDNKNIYWDDFLQFFRSTGLLLEYEKQARYHQELKKIQHAMQKQQQQQQKDAYERNVPQVNESQSQRIAWALALDYRKTTVMRSSVDQTDTGHFNNIEPRKKLPAEAPSSK
eukprot:TRINITY_DN365_c0_g1_i1.p1 TRINITY_DN365_c0_g1~~TRINITY_DN365_c0_g1_i1.p1  ORF type:complete len:283 (-),score=50.26 TRINITY_DN365_c0_g1_i1:96-944(-)